VLARVTQGPLAILLSSPQINFIKYPADTENEREKKGNNTLWYKLIIIYIPNQSSAFYIHASVLWPTQALQLFFLLQIKNLLIKSSVDSVSKMICFSLCTSD
jgi:hypothetical protein